MKSKREKMSIPKLSKNIHLLSRAGFGPKLLQVKDLEKKSTDYFWKILSTEKPFKKISFDSKPADVNYESISKLGNAQKRKILALNRQQNLELNLNFFNEMVASEDQLREKMAFFWHGHFATRIGNSTFNEQLLNTIREKALGNFKDLLLAVSKSPAMLQFLNNQQNRKGRPNENFAREVMELFTMGRGNYTEKDVREAARAFTGWGYQNNGTFLFRNNQHDERPKIFLGKSGNLNGDDVLNLILQQKATAKFITTKIYKFFVNERTDAAIIENLSMKFYNSNYNIKQLLTEIFTSDWFYSEKNIGTKIKSPIELMVGIMRIVPMKIEKTQNLIVYQKLLGQMLLYPPNVAGWPSGTSWIDSSTLLLRMQIPQIWTGLRPLEVVAKSDDDLDMGMKPQQNLEKYFKNAQITVDWNFVEKHITNKNYMRILLVKPPSFSMDLIKKFTDSSPRMNIISTMSTPDYQLC